MARDVFTRDGHARAPVDPGSRPGLEIPGHAGILPFFREVGRVSMAAKKGAIFAGENEPG